MFPYVQVHEFEGLLFSHVDAFEAVFDNAPMRDLRSIRFAFKTPEDINDGKDTAQANVSESSFRAIEDGYTGPL